MKFIIGLGNPGKEYENSRHNVGKWIIGQLKNFQFSIFNFQLTKSTVFMNESGKFVKRLMDRYKIPLDDLLIIHDDLDIPLGEFRIHAGRGAAGHKGVESVIAVLADNNFWRLRIGIGRPPEGVDPEEYVLGKFDGEELKKIVLMLPEIIKEMTNLFVSNN